MNHGTAMVPAKKGLPPSPTTTSAFTETDCKPGTNGYNGYNGGCGTNSYNGYRKQANSAQGGASNFDFSKSIYKYDYRDCFGLLMGETCKIRCRPGFALVMD
jgi:hypothetical protein